MNNFLQQYGLNIVAVIIVLAFIVFASVFGDTITTGVKDITADFFAKSGVTADDDGISYGKKYITALPEPGSGWSSEFYQFEFYRDGSVTIYNFDDVVEELPAGTYTVDEMKAIIDEGLTLREQPTLNNYGFYYNTPYVLEYNGGKAYFVIYKNGTYSLSSAEYSYWFIEDDDRVVFWSGIAADFTCVPQNNGDLYQDSGALMGFTLYPLPY